MIKSIAAGVYIGIGALVYTLIDNKLVGSVLFSLGLLTIFLRGLDLYTGKVGYYVWDKSRWLELMKIWIGNYLGISLVLALGIASRLHPVTDVATKVNDSWLSLLLLGIGCGLLMFTATRFWQERKMAIGVILCVVVFIQCGFEHCVADMFYLGCSLEPITFVDVLRVLLFVTLGNTIGGALGFKLLED